MSENLPAAPNGQYVQGTIVPDPATDVVPAGDVKAHAFFNVLRDLLHGSNLYRDEQMLEAAIESVSAFEKHILTGNTRAVVQETDRAPREDVTQRRAPQVGTAVVPAASPNLDYNRLAAAIVALQQQQRNESGPAPEEGQPA